MTRSILTALCALLFACSYAYAESEAPPNVVLIISDDQGYTDYGFMGHPEIETPNLDKLAKEIALFRRGYVPTALCRPSLMTLITGLYSHQNKTTGNDPANTPANKAHAEKAGKDAMELLISHIDKTGSLPRWLAEKGYVSYQSGKWWEGSYQRGGFTEGMTAGFPKPRGRHGDAGLKIGREGMAPVFDFIDHIENSGIKENTLVLYVCDNGWIQTEQGSYAPRSKRSPNEHGTRTPIMFRWPGTIPAADRPELCSSIDFVPTVLAAAGATGPHDFPGLNLLPELKSGKAIDRDTLFGESFAHDIADIENHQASLLYRWAIRGHDKLLPTYDGAPGKMKYPPQSGEPQLFDLKTDSGEKRNLASKNPERVKQLRTILNEWYVPDHRQVGEFAPVAPKTNRERKPARNAKKRSASAKAKTTKPNNLLLYADDQRNHTLGCAGHPIVRTPNIDALAKDGVRFEDAFVTTSTCWVGRSCLFTGRYERKHLCRVTPGPLSPELGCLGGHPQTRTPNIDRIAARGMLFTNAHCQGTMCNPSRISLLWGRRPSSTGFYDNHYHVSKEPEFLKSHVSLPAHFAASGYRTLTAGTVFHGGTPRQSPVVGPRLGQWLKGLDQAVHKKPKRWHRTWDFGPQDYDESKFTDHVTATWVADQLGRKHDKPVELLSIYPTLIDLCGLPANPRLEGVSFQPLLKSPNADWEHVAISTLGQNNHAVRDQRWRYIRYSDGSEELYDHQTDPNEWNNLAAESPTPSHSEVIAQLKKHLPKTNATRQGNEPKK